MGAICYWRSRICLSFHGTSDSPPMKGLFVRECAEGSRCSRKMLYVCVCGGGEMYLLLVRGVSRSKTLIPLILSQSGWMLFITTINNYSPNTYRYRFKWFMWYSRFECSEGLGWASLNTGLHGSLVVLVDLHGSSANTLSLLRIRSGSANRLKRDRAEQPPPPEKSVNSLTFKLNTFTSFTTHPEPWWTNASNLLNISCADLFKTEETWLKTVKVRVSAWKPNIYHYHPIVLKQNFSNKTLHLNWNFTPFACLRMDFKARCKIPKEQAAHSEDWEPNHFSLDRWEKADTLSASSAEWTSFPDSLCWVACRCDQSASQQQLHGGPMGKWSWKRLDKSVLPMGIAMGEGCSSTTSASLGK